MSARQGRVIIGRGLISHRGTENTENFYILFISEISVLLTCKMHKFLCTFREIMRIRLKE